MFIYTRKRLLQNITWCEQNIYLVLTALIQLNDLKVLFIYV